MRGIYPVKKIIISICLLGLICGCSYAEDAEYDAAKDKAISEIGTLVNSQKYQAALTKCDSALKKYPQEAFLYYWKGTILSAMNEKRAALESYDKSIELNPDNAKTYVMRGVCKSDLGDKDSALEDYNKAIELDPNDGSAYSMRACVKLELGDFTGANEDLDKANELLKSK